MGWICLEVVSMEHLQYVIEDSTIAELLGVQNFTNKESAILELVKNSYDAKAPKVTIQFINNELWIVDDGKGMNENDIRTNWMHVGKSEKGYSIIDEKSHKRRILAGSKGIGRFALARLGSHVTVYTTKSDCTSVKWETDWNESTLDKWEGKLTSPTGTKIVISSLRDKWTESSIHKLAEYLSITYNDTAMKIEILSEKDKYNVIRYFENPELGENCVSKINLKYDCKNKTLTCDIFSDEFQDKAQEYYPLPKLKYFEKAFDVISELQSDQEIEASNEELYSLLEKLGDFTAEFYFSLKSSTTKDVENFLYKYQNLPERYENGVVLYRNAFSISSYEGSKDWLGFGKRSRKSPAAATHPTGAWRVRENQISGKVIIDKLKNYNLKDLSNRQGLDENVYFQIFVKILDVGIAAFERYRQDIIKAIDVKNEVTTEQKTTLINQIIKNPRSISTLTEQDSKMLADELVSMQKTTEVYKDEKKSTEERYRYDVRILNLFATSGLKATSIAHEIKNDRNSISTNYNYIVEALKEYGFWDDLSSPELTMYAYKNVPELLLRNKEVNQKLLVFMDTMLDEAEKRKFEPQILNIASVMDFIKANWERDYVWLKICCNVDDVLCFRMAEDVLTVIFDNLILNSVQQNEKHNKLNITISVAEKGGSLQFSYHDDGNGLPQKYINDPERILIVHETSRKNGHGLGMWIVNNTVKMTGGHILKIDGHNGFSIDFVLGAEL